MINGMCEGRDGKLQKRVEKNDDLDFTCMFSSFIEEKEQVKIYTALIVFYNILKYIGMGRLFISDKAENK